MKANELDTAEKVLEWVVYEAEHGIAAPNPPIYPDTAEFLAECVRMRLDSMAARGPLPSVKELNRRRQQEVAAEKLRKYIRDFACPMDVEPMLSLLEQVKRFR